MSIGISMHPSANYVTQSALWSGAQIKGNLTDHAIRKYERQGRYGEEYKEQQRARIKKMSRRSRQDFAKQLLEGLL